MIGENRLFHSYRKIGKALVGVVRLPTTIAVCSCPSFPDASDDDNPTITVSTFQHRIGCPAVDGGFE